MKSLWLRPVPQPLSSDPCNRTYTWAWVDSMGGPHHAPTGSSPTRTPTATRTEARATRARLKDKRMLAEPLVIFAIKFRPWCWWYEVYTLVRRFGQWRVRADLVSREPHYTLVGRPPRRVGEREPTTLVRR